MENMQEIREQFLEYLETKGYSPATIKSRRVELKYFFSWCEEREIRTPQCISKSSITRYQKYLCYYRNEKTGKGLSYHSQEIRLCVIKTFCQWLVKTGILSSNPALDLEYPKRNKRLPHNILNEEEVEKILEGVDINSPSGIRDRALVETIYSTGIRRQEAGGLKIGDIDWHRGSLYIKHGKNRKERIIPIGDRALGWIEIYLKEVRKYIAKEPDEGDLFLGMHGKALSLISITVITHRYLKKAGITKSGSCHIFRHTAATLMLENGADIRYIQEMLGHACLNTTQLYTKVIPSKLKEVHEKTHPAGKRSEETEEEKT